MDVEVATMLTKNYQCHSAAAEVSEQICTLCPFPFSSPPPTAPACRCVPRRVLKVAGPGAERRVDILDGLIEGSTCKSARKGHFLEVSPPPNPFLPARPPLAPLPSVPSWVPLGCVPQLQTRPHTCMRVRPEPHQSPFAAFRAHSRTIEKEGVVP